MKFPDVGARIVDLSGGIGLYTPVQSSTSHLFVVLLVIFNILSSHTILAQYQQPVQADWNTADYLKREHSLSKPYQGAGWQIPNWDFQGSTIVTNQYIRLTPDSRSQQGSLWNAAPIRMHNWEVQLQIKVHGRGKDLFGDGMVFWYARDRMIPGPIFGSKDYFMGMAVFVDTYSNHNGPHNHQHPYVSAMINNGTMHYDHDRDGTHTQIAGCEAKLRNIDQDAWLAIRYENEVLTVSTDFLGKNAWAPCLKVEGVKLPTGYYFGLSAATGDLSDNHDVITVKTYELESGGVRPEDDRSRDSILPSALTYEAPREHVDDVKPGWSGVKIFLVTLFSILGVIAVGVVGIIVYQNHQQNTRKRFY
ncbi:VIP36-like protein [Orchesella cincta]|uniref:VIP36-like protein n=1 Tax=Orchesella cincta TaxID=48709 RepID=A0A1D2MEN7_ORCCI|nr:VIP36-like protein [Orchesella cincta]